MNNDILQGKWKQLRGDAKQKWGMLTDDDLDSVEGNRDKLVGMLQEKYGYAHDRAEQEVNQFLNQYQDQSQNTMGQMSDTSQQMMDQMSDKSQYMAGKAQQMMGQMGDRSQQMMNQMADRMPGPVGETMNRYPWMTIGIAALALFLVAALVMRSRS